MAAPIVEESWSGSEMDSLSNSENNSESDSKDEMADFLVQFVDKEIGSDLKSLGKVSALLEKLKTENKDLEEQASSTPT